MAKKERMWKRIFFNSSSPVEPPHRRTAEKKEKEKKKNFTDETYIKPFYFNRLCVCIISVPAPLAVFPGSRAKEFCSLYLQWLILMACNIVFSPIS